MNAIAIPIRPIPKPDNKTAASINPYLAFAEFRIAKHRAKPTSETFRFFRQTVHHSILWMIIMRGYYVDHLPSLKECIHEVRISKDTVRKIINDAEAKGYLEWRASPHDGRIKLVAPTMSCITEFETLVDNYSKLLG